MVWMVEVAAAALERTLRGGLESYCGRVLLTMGEMGWGGVI